jgi:TRAP-type C4-dicarboxylate transport system permease small subunit
MIFLSIPAMTQQRAHIAVSYLIEGLPEGARRRSALAVTLIAAVVCLIAAWITGAETWRQYVSDTQTISASPISKWWVSIFIP